jgi:hypothetical protein
MASEEQLYGREGNEAAQGYQPMPAATTDEPSPDLERDEAITKWADDREKEAATKPLVERQYVRPDDNKPQPDNRTVELDRAANDLKENREFEEDVAEFERTQKLAAEIDTARGLRPDLAQPAEAQPTQQQQPEPTELEKYNAALAIAYGQPATDALASDPEVQKALSNPRVLHAINEQRQADAVRVDQAERNAAARADQAIGYAAQWARTNAEIAAAAILARPELQGVHPSQLGGALQALKTANPQAAQQSGPRAGDTDD